MKLFQPTQSYSIELPENVNEKTENNVVSFWKDGSNLLLQISSYTSQNNDRISSEIKLEEIKKKNGGKWNVYSIGKLSDENVSVAAAITEDKGYYWAHVVLSWPGLQIYGTISSDRKDELMSYNWALDSIRRIRPI